MSGKTTMSKNFKSKLAKRIKDIRTNLGYSQQEVADVLGIHRPSVSQIEHSDRELSAEELSKISELFGMTESEILDSAKKVDSKTDLGSKPKKNSKDGILITFYRHGEATDDIYDQYGGWADPSLSPKGVNKAYTIAQNLKNRPAVFDIIFTSPLKRAKQVAEIIGRELKTDVKVSQYLKERNTYGLLCGINKKVAQTKFPDLVKTYESGDYVLGSERYEDFTDRLPLIFDYIKKSGYKNVCCITHGKILKAIIKHMLKMNPDKLDDGCMLTIGLDKGKMYYVQSEGISFSKE